MIFNLTDSLVCDIQNALDNQEAEFLVDAQKNILVKKTGGILADESFFYEVPKWDSADGFKLRESFVARLNAPLAKQELAEVLHFGRGVFRNFKDTLKKYPEIEKRWFVYKNRIQREFINQWYNNLREMWGLEKLDYFPESDENLIHDDFSFELYSDDKKNLIIENAGYFFRENSDNQTEEFSAAWYELWKNLFYAGGSEPQTGFICMSLSDDFAGCITVAPVSKNTEQIMILTSFFVPVEFRGLGIGTELLAMCLSDLKERGKRWILIPNAILPDTLITLLMRNGFEKTAYGLASKLDKE